MNEEIIKVIREIMDELRNGDLEFGSPAMNDMAAARFNKSYPFLSRKLSELEWQANQQQQRKHEHTESKISTGHRAIVAADGSR